MRAVIFANGPLTKPFAPGPQDLVIAADGGGQHCLNLGITPHIVIGDFDSLDKSALAALEANGVEFIRYPRRKDYTDLELALLHAKEKGADEIVVLAALGARLDQTLANLLLPSSPYFASVHIRLVDGQQEIMVVRSGETLELNGAPGDTVSLIPVYGEVSGINTTDLEYPLENGTLVFGSTRGISNLMLGKTALVSIKKGVLLCIIIHATA